MRNVIFVIIGLGGGAVVSAAVFAFIAAIGIIPRMAQRTKTLAWIRYYEDVILIGGLCGTITMFVDFNIPLSPFFIGAISLAVGMFTGVLAIALAEVLNVSPIMMKRFNLRRGMRPLLLAFAFGKVAGSLLYFMKDGFYTP